MRASEELPGWDKVAEVTLGGDVITPIAYDSTTQEYEVASFPSWASAAVDTEFYAGVVALDLTDVSVLPNVYAGGSNNSNFIKIKKTDSTHFVITAGAPPIVDVTKWKLCERTSYSKIEILPHALYESLRGLPLRVIIENTTTYITQYVWIHMNGLLGYTQGPGVRTTDSNALGYDIKGKYLGYIDFEMEFSTSDYSVTFTKINGQWCYAINNRQTSGAPVYLHSENLTGATSGTIWGMNTTRNVCLGGYGINRPDCTIKVYKQKT